jgi:hypothetical protein
MVADPRSRSSRGPMDRRKRGAKRCLDPVELRCLFYRPARPLPILGEHRGQEGRHGGGLPSQVPSLTGYSAGGRLASAVWLPELFAELIEVAGNVVVRLGVLRILFMLVAVVAVVALVATVATA